MKKILLYSLAFICVICPLCNIARAKSRSCVQRRDKPQSSWAKFIFGKLAEICPFCRAYKKIRG
ncbi:MAG: hypothetical protein AB1633_02230 [Elusimicrobiota bacterium]